MRAELIGTAQKQNHELVGFEIRTMQLAQRKQTPKGVWIRQRQIEQQPTRGAAWDNLLAWARKGVGPAEIGHATQADVALFARGLVMSRTRVDPAIGNWREIIDTLPSLPRNYNALSLGRSLPSYIFFCDLVDYRSEKWLAWLKEIRDTKLTNGGGPAHSLVTASETRPNNWGQHCNCARVAIDLFTNDEADLKTAVDVFYGFIGDQQRWTKWGWGSELSWMNGSLATPINPPPGMLSGCIPDDMRRGGSFEWPPGALKGISYSWECLQALTVTAEMLYQAGYRDAWTATDNAILRAVKFLYSIPGGLGMARGDDLGTLHLIHARYGWKPTENLTYGCPPGKNCGFLDFTHGSN